MLYDNCSSTNINATCTGFHSERVPSSLSGLGTSWHFLWSSTEHSNPDGGHALDRYFYPEESKRHINPRNDNPRIVCLGDW